MANKRISELAAAGALTGAELVEAVQGGVNVQTTTQNIANLAPATPGAEAFLDLTDVPNSYSGEANKVVSVKADESGLEFTTPASGTVTAGSGITVSGSTVNWGSTNGDQTITDGFHNFDPINDDAAQLVFGELARIAEFRLYANAISLNPASAATFEGTSIAGYNSSSVHSSIGIVKGSGGVSLDGAYVHLFGGSLNAVNRVLHIRKGLTGTNVGSNGIGEKIAFTIANSVDNDYSPEAGLSYILTDVTDGSEDSKYVLSALVNGVETTVAEFTGAGIAMGGNKITGLGAATANGDAVRYEQVIETSATALVDGSAITLTTNKHTLTTSQSTITFTDSYAGDFMIIEVTLSGVTSVVLTFPASSLCRFEGASSSDNTMTITGVSGDKILLSRWKVGSAYHWVGINNLQ